APYLSRQSMQVACRSGGERPFHEMTDLRRHCLAFEPIAAFAHLADLGHRRSSCSSGQYHRRSAFSILTTYPLSMDSSNAFCSPWMGPNIVLYCRTEDSLAGYHQSRPLAFSRYNLFLPILIASKRPIFVK